MGKIDKAKAAYSELSTLVSANAPAHAQRGELRRHSAEYDKAGSCYTEALRFEPGNGMAVTGLVALRKT